jgi:hypothetical protein
MVQDVAPTEGRKERLGAWYQVLELPAELPLLGMDQEAAVQGRDGVALPAGGVERSGEVEVEKARAAPVPDHGFLAEGDAPVTFPGESEEESAIGKVGRVAASAFHQPAQRSFGGAERAAAIVAHRLLEENFALDRFHETGFLGTETG